MARVIVFGLLLIFLTSGCEEDVAGPAGVDEPYSVYGIINPRLERQTILVSSTEDRLSSMDSALDAVVTSSNLTTGTSYTWRDTVARNAAGQLDHIFMADFRPDFESRHRVDIIRSDGEAARVEVDVPARVSLNGEDTGTRIYYVDILGDDISLVRLDVAYTVRGYPGSYDNPLSRYTYAMKRAVEKVEGGWRLRVNLNLHYEEMRGLYNTEHKTSFGGNPVCSGLGLFDLEVSMTIGSDDWNLPGGHADANTLSHPGTLRNVENAFGFVGGGYNEDRSLLPSRLSIEDTFFFDFIRGRTPRFPPGICRQ